MSIDRKRLIEIKNKGPIFIVGCQRSGTSLLYRILSETLDIGFGRDNTLFLNKLSRLQQYSDLWIDNNLKKLLSDIEHSQIFKQRFKGMKIYSHEFISCLEKREYADIVRTIYAYWALLQGKTRWGGKTPDYTAKQETLKELFPDVKIIHIIRDGRDVSLSLQHTKWGPKDIFLAAKYWKIRVTRGLTGRSNIGEEYYELKYEEILKHPQTTFAGILSFLNYSEDETQKALEKFRNDVVSGLRSDNAFKWKHKMNQADNLLFEIAAGDLLERNGYEIINHNYKKLKINLLQKVFHYYNDILIKLKKGYLFRSLRKLGFLYRY